MPSVDVPHLADVDVEHAGALDVLGHDRVDHDDDVDGERVVDAEIDAGVARSRVLDTDVGEMQDVD